MIEYNMILNRIWKEGSLNFVQIVNSKKMPHTSPLRASYGASFDSSL